MAKAADSPPSIDATPIAGWTRPTAFFLLTFVVALLPLLAFFTQEPQLYGNDAYYHLAIARTYFEEGIVDDLRWVRFSALGEDFGDKEVLFHLLLAPFAGLAANPVLGGQIALSLLLAGLFASIAVLARPILGNWALLLPFWLVFASTELA